MKYTYKYKRSLVDNAIPEGPTLTNSKTSSEKNRNFVGLNYYNVLNYDVILVSALALMTTDPESLSSHSLSVTSRLQMSPKFIVSLWARCFHGNGPILKIMGSVYSDKNLKGSSVSTDVDSFGASLEPRMLLQLGLFIELFTQL